MEVRIHFLYHHPKLPSVGFHSEWMNETVSLALIKDLEKTGRMKELTIEDDLGQKWSLKDYKKLLTKTAETKSDVSIEFDGSFNNHTKEAGLGIVLYYKESNKRFKIKENAHNSYLNSNNEAEYAAFYRAIQLCEELSITHQKINVKGDSLVVINQFNGEWPCYEPVFNEWLDKIENLTKKLHLKVEAKAVRRNDNKDADKLAAQALEGTEIRSEMEFE